MSFDLEDVLDLEADFHEEGFAQGSKENTTKEYIEGKEYGYQISFQRFLAIGYYKVLIQHWLQVISEQQTPTPKISATQRTLADLLQNIETIKFENTEANGIQFDALMKKLKLKVRLANVTMAKLCGDRLADMNTILQDVGGVLEIEKGDSTVDDVDNGMW